MTKRTPSAGSGALQEVVLVGCGAYSPVTYLHLRMFENARDWLHVKGLRRVVGGVMSPVHDGYGKRGLLPAVHRVAMCGLATRDSWVRVDAWESSQPRPQRTLHVLEHVQRSVHRTHGPHVRVMLLAGADLVEAMCDEGGPGRPRPWREDLVRALLGRFGVVALEREGTDLKRIVLEHELTFAHVNNVLVVPAFVHNNVSSSKLRMLARHGLSIRYLTPPAVVRYLREHRLLLPRARL